MEKYLFYFLLSDSFAKKKNTQNAGFGMHSSKISTDGPPGFGQQPLAAGLLIHREG